uniref:RanBP2-type domain-containing protein n=1 Tax=Strigamia maritima TaxID=126957 RepID=T1JLM5_STRMM
MTAGAVSAPIISAVRRSANCKLYNYIDTETAIEIRCETPNVEIYYTLNGTAPNPFPLLGCDNKTLKYCHPLYLEEGRCMIKAIAIDTVKSRESFVVSKSFSIEQVDKSGDDLAAKSNINEATSAPTPLTLPSISEISEKERQDDEKDFDEQQDAATSNESDLDELDASNSEETENSESHFIDHFVAEFQNGKERKSSKSSTTSEEMEFNEPQLGKNFNHFVDSLRCSKCSYSNHATPTAQFCSLCGHQLANQMALIVTLPSLQQMARCEKCFCNVPHDVPYCIICETSFTDANTIAYNKFINSKMCSDCSTLNSSRSLSCVLCENTLPKKTFQSTANPLLLPTIVNTSRHFTKCEDCGRVNCCQARYCDWCGKLLREELILECPQCFNQNQSMASFCQGCGYPLQPPVNLDVNARLLKKTCDESVLAQPSIQQKSTMTSPWAISQSKSIQTSETVSCLSQKWQRSIGRMQNIESFMESYCKPCSATSPGKGYWRQQVEHIAGHLKTTAYNDSAFRSQISKAKLTNLLSTNVEEGSDEFSLLLKFGVKPSPEKDTKKAKIEHSTEKNATFEEKSPKSLPPVSDKVQKQKPMIKEKLEEVDLIKLIQKSSTASQLKKLLGKFVNESKNWKTKNCEGNSPLHEAILLKEKGLDSVKQLLKCGVDPGLVNNNGQTAYELAKSINNQSAVKLLTTNLGKNMLNEMVKSELKILI